MELDNNLKNYIKPSMKIALVQIFLLLASIACIMGSIYFEANYESPDPVKFSKNLSENTYCYVDVQYLTRWLVKDDNNTYYCAADKDKNQFTISIKDDDLSQFNRIIAYTYSEDAEAVAPHAIRVTGKIHKISDYNADQMVKSWEFKSKSEYYNKFGSQVFYAGQSVSSVPSIILIIAGIILLPTSLIGLIVIALINGKSKKSIEILNQNCEYQKAEYELSQPERYIYNKMKVIFTENFIIIKNKGIAVNYNNVEWFFKRVQTVNGIMTNMELVIFTMPHGQIHVINVAFKKKLQDDLYFLMDVIAAKNPNAIGGYCPASRKEFKRRRKQYKLYKNTNM